MQRSRTQVLFSYLPDSIFEHESGYLARSVEIRGERAHSIHGEILLKEIGRYLSSWDDDRVQGLGRPGRVDDSDFLILTPELVRWELWPLRFECARESCRRIASFRRIDDIGRRPRCQTCGGRLRHLRYLSAHECGAIRAMHIPPCTTHGYDDVYFEDTGTFRTAVFRCRACNGGIVRRTLQSPCSCNLTTPDGDKPMMHAYTVRDTRTYFAHYISLINLQSSTFNQLQAHPRRGEISVASFLGLLGPSHNLKQGLREANQLGHSARLSPEKWTARELQLREMGLTEEEIDAIRSNLAPSATGLAPLSGIEPAVVDEVGERRHVVERAALFDTDEVSRLSLHDARESLRQRGESAAATTVATAMERAHELGVDDISVTWSFPIALAAFGYTRTTGRVGEGTLRGFSNRPDQYDNKYPIFAVATDTEAVLIALDPSRVLEWLADHGALEAPDGDPRLQLLRVFATEESNPVAAGLVRTLVHTMSHTMLRALDDGQVGFSESSLAEWIVPETLTFALYANNFKSVTMGSLWTLINNRSLQWLDRSANAARRCDNDPLCHQRTEQACERCLYITFGCQEFNRNLDRRVLRSYWRHA